MTPPPPVTMLSINGLSAALDAPTLAFDAPRHVLAVRPPQHKILHFLTVDSCQHDHGVNSPEAR